MKRRKFLAKGAAAGLAWAALEFVPFRAIWGESGGETHTYPPVRAITRGPLFHWGAYYDQVHFDPTNRWVVGNETSFEGRSPRPEDRIQVGVIDTGDGDRWTELGSTLAWNWQQGCMLQFIPGEGSSVVWNDRGKEDFFATVCDIQTGEKRTLPGPVYALSPDGKFTVHPDFRRLNDTRPGYGYGGIPDPNAETLIPKNAGIWRMDLTTGAREMLFSFADVAAIPRQNPVAGEPPFPVGVKHWFNHLIVSPDSKRFLFLHRWQRETGKSAWFTRLLTAKIDGTDLRVVSDDAMVSHLVWRDPKHIIAFARNRLAGDRFYLFDIDTGEAIVYGKEIMKVDGHVSYLPGTDSAWILNDTYPNKDRNQTPFLFHLATEKKIELGAFRLPPEYTGEWRCDLHPRSSRDGRKVLIDSAHEGGRQIYLIDLAEISLEP